MVEARQEPVWKTWQCEVCGWIYDEEKGSPAEGLAPGTRWADIPDDWQCPECRAFKRDFVMVELNGRMEISSDEESYRRHDGDPRFAGFPVVVVGSGLAGYDVVKELRALGNHSDVVVVTADDGAYYPKPAISNAIGLHRSAEDIRIASAAEMERKLRITVRADTKARTVKARSHRLVLAGGEEIPYSKLVLATGSICIDPQHSGDGLAYVEHVNSLADYGRFRERLGRARRVVIIGGGLIGCEFADDLACAGYQVCVIEISDRPLQSLLPAAASEAVIAGLSEQGVTFKLGRRVARIGRAGHGAVVELDDGECLGADLILSAIGVTPNTALACRAGLEVNRGIVVNSFLETSEIDVFALGDCAEIQQMVLPFVMPLTAAARALAQTINGRNTEVRYGVMPVHIKMPSVPVIRYQAPSSKGCCWSVLCSDGIHCKAECRDEEGTLVGVALTGSFTDEKNDYVQRLPPLMSESFITRHGRSVPDYFYRPARNWKERLAQIWWGA